MNDAACEVNLTDVPCDGAALDEAIAATAEGATVVLTRRQVAALIRHASLGPAKWSKEASEPPQTLPAGYRGQSSGPASGSDDKPHSVGGGEGSETRRRAR